MSTLTKFITASIIALLMTSCNLDINLGPGVTGDGNVVTEERNVSKKFNNIAATRGIDVVLTQNNSTSIVVEADANLQDIITTEIIGNTLKITASENIRSSSSKKVYVSLPKLSNISTTSGASVTTESTFKSDQLTISSTSGSQIDVDVITNSLSCNTTSGAGIRISGNTKKLNVSATSGSYIRADNLEAETTKASATSGANISVNTTEAITANANSGASIKYSGNPETVSKSDGVSGSIRKI